MMRQNIVRCQWCGAEGALSDFEFDHTHKNGFWCPDCDGHTYLCDEENAKRRILLLLERKESPLDAGKFHYRLKKRLSPLRYPGGKSKIAEYLAAQFRLDQMETFAEAFAGGASVGLALLDAGLILRLLLNDADKSVAAFWRQITENPESIYRRLDESPPTAEDFYAAKLTLDKPQDYSQEDLPWSLLIANRLSFSGITKACILGGKNGTDAQRLARWNPKSIKKRISQIYAMRNRISVFCEDAADFIESTYWDNQTTLFIDPPYVKQGAKLYRKFFYENDHKHLANTIESLYRSFPGADIVLTYDDCAFIRELYPDAEIKTIERKYSI